MPNSFGESSWCVIAKETSKILLFSCILLVFISCKKNNEKQDTQNETTTNENITTDTDKNITTEIRFVNSPEGLNVRSAPGLSGNKIFILPNKKQVKIIATEEEEIVLDGVAGKWTYIDVEQGNGWVFGGYLQTQEESIQNLQNNIIGTWYVYETNGKKPDTWWDGWVFNHDVKIPRTIQWDICYEFRPDKTFYNGRQGSGMGYGGNWKVTNGKINLYGTMYYEGEESVTDDFDDLISVEYIDDDHIVFTQDSNGLREKIVKWNEELVHLISEKDYQGAVNYFSIPAHKKYINAQFENGVTALMYAAAFKSGEIGIYLISIGADVNAKNIYGLTALHYACESNIVEDSENLIKKLIDSEADINAKDENGQTPLDYTLYDTRRNTSKLADIQGFIKFNGGTYGNEERESYAEKQAQ
jgi:hypothetical protein